MSIDPATILAIAAMAAVTAATRLAGLWLVRVVQPAGRVAAPGALGTADQAVSAKG